MQIFRLHEDIEENPKHYPDNYVHNQIREAALAMSSAINLSGGEGASGTTHEHHPITQWLISYENWMECYDLIECVHDEYDLRYGNAPHGSWIKIKSMVPEAEKHLPRDGGTLQPCAFKPEYKTHMEPTSMAEVVENYRDYFRQVKWPQEWCQYQKAVKPEWL